MPDIELAFNPLLGLWNNSPLTGKEMGVLLGYGFPLQCQLPGTTLELRPGLFQLVD